MKSKTFFFISDGVAKIIRKKLPYHKYIPVPKTTNKIIVFLYHIYIYIYLSVYTKIKMIPKGLPTFGHDFLKWSDYFVHSTNNFNLIEDGTGNYIYPVKFSNKYRTSFFYRFLVNSFPMFTLPFGLSKNVGTIYLTKIAEVPQLIEDKVKLIDIQQLWMDLTKEQQEEILSIYVDEKEINKLFSSNRSIILLTQCFSEDGVWTEDEKIATYKRLLSGYSLNEVIIKMHPREKTNYKKIFPEAMVIDSPIPFQLLNILNINLKIAITYNSTAIYCLPDKVQKIIVQTIS